MLISLDMGFKNTGWSVFDNGIIIDVGIIVTAKSTKKGIRVSDDYFNRASVLTAGLQELLRFAPEGIIAELPSGGSQNARASSQMGIATGVIASFCTITHLPFEGATPQEVKLASTGMKKATKEEVMDAIVKKFNWTKEIKQYKKGVGVTFKLFDDRTYNKGQFEHIADSVGAYLALQQNNLVKMYG